MWRHVHHRLVVGYHGCDQAVARSVLLGEDQLVASRNPWDWLGEGVYFWENSRRRALQFAIEQRDRGKFDEPAVLGAYIHLGRCFDLTDTDATAKLSGFYEDYLIAMGAIGQKPASNKPGGGSGDDLLLRDLDCAVLNLGLRNLASAPPCQPG